MQLRFLICIISACSGLHAQILSWAVGNTYRNANNPLYWKNKKPFEGYWQQDVYYQIKARLDDAEETITGEEELTYYNNSPNTLTKAYFHLYQNAVQPGSLVDNLYTVNETPHEFGKYEAMNLGTSIESFTVNGLAVSFKINYTVLECGLPKALAPGDSCKFKISFKTYFDRGSIRRRMKVYDHDGYKHFNGVHWYPRICVYDQKFSWETAQHMEHEFYGDFGAYDVELQMPNEYVNEATGVLQNPQEAYPGNLRQRLDISNFKNKPVGEKPSVITSKDNTLKSWKYHAENVHDFAWTADPTYRIGELVWNGIQCIALAQENNAGKWQAVDTFIAFVLKTYGRDFGKYEYPKMVAADAADGMEYPMLTLDGGLYPSNQGLIAHEVGHNWFFGMLGNNETYRASLDEGFTQFLTSWCMKKAKGQFRFPNDIDYSTAFAGYMMDAIDGTDAVLNTHSDDFNTAIGHGGGYRHVYYKTATMLYNLQYVLGDSVFLKAMQHYVAQWKICHPYIEDFRNSITAVAQTDLNWFFDQWFETTKYCDYGISKVKKGKDGKWNIKLQRNGTMVMPVDLRITTADGNKLNITVPVSYYKKPENLIAQDMWLGWGNLRKIYNLNLNLPSAIKAVELDPSYRLADINRLDNNWHRLIDLSFNKENAADRDYRTGYNLYWRPDAWYSYTDGLRAGIKLSGDYAARKHIFNLYLWGQNGKGLDHATQKVAYWFDYRNFLRKNGEVFVESRFLANVWIHKAGWEKNTNRGRLSGYFKYITSGNSQQQYLPGIETNAQYFGFLSEQGNWSKGVNFSANLVYIQPYAHLNNTGSWQIALRSAMPWSDASYAYLKFTWLNQFKMERRCLEPGCLGKQAQGKKVQPKACFMQPALILKKFKTTSLCAIGQHFRYLPKT
jgi:aminopeptidase N